MNWKATGVIITLVILGVAVVADWATSQEQQENFAEDMISLRRNSDINKQGIVKNEKDILVLQTDVSYIRKGIDEIKGLMKGQ